MPLKTGYSSETFKKDAPDKTEKAQMQKLRFMKKARMEGKSSPEMEAGVHKSIAKQLKESSRKRKILERLRGEK